MKTVQLPLDDLIFENRNQSYGSYELRKLYPKHISRALTVAALAMTLGLFAPYLYARWFPENVEASTAVVNTFTDIQEPPPIDKNKPQVELPPVPPPPKMATQRWVQPEPEPDELLTKVEDIPTVEEVAKAQISTVTQAGEPDDGTTIIEVDETQKAGEVVGIETNQFVLVAEQMPVFHGGYAELMKYLSRNLRYPKQAIANGVEGNVYIRFVVNTDGSIADATVLKGVGYGCDEEALRVVNAMPSWTAGKQNGKPVRVQFNLPIKFKLAN